MDAQSLLQLRDQRESGRRLVLATIRDSGRIARIDISRETGVSPATVTSITGELIRAGLVEEIARDPDRSDSKRGRPRVDLKIRAEAHVIAGIKLSDRIATAALIDFEGNLIGQHQAQLASRQFATGQIAPFIARLLDDTVEDAGIGKRELSGVGLGLPGM
ncbi:MAG: winged helix-turn-helix transcriptional regulator, partial [Paracoccaceae bacterium]